jgi:hypothetical protein
MSKLHAYLERYFPATLWDPQGSRDATIETDDEAAPSNASSEHSTAYRRKNHTKGHEISYIPSIKEGDRWNEDDVRRTFMENYGVSVRIASDLKASSGDVPESSHFLFKYYVILQAKSTWLSDDTGVLGDCRGTIMQCVKGVGWRVAARPFEKFFNQQEAACPVHTSAAFNAHVDEYEFVEKADGTMMVLWFRKSSIPGPSGALGSWQWSTSTGLLADIRWVRAVTPFLHVKSAVTEIESELAGSAQNHNVVAESLLDVDRTYVFELCCKDTQVITKYTTERIYLLGSLDSKTGNTSTQDELDEIALKLHILRPTRCKAKDEAITSLEKALEWVEMQSKPNENSGRFGEWPEGFVVYYLDRPICKLKNRAYNDRHVFYSSDLLHMRNLMIERYFAGTTDDVIGFCPSPIIAFVDELATKIQRLLNIAIDARASFITSNKTKLEAVPKETRPSKLAELVRSDPSLTQLGLQMGKFFLKHKEVILGDPLPADSTVKEMYMAWLDLNWKSIMEYWRATEIAEILEEDRSREKERVPRKVTT